MEETSKGSMFFIVNDTKSFIKLECSVSQSSAMTHPCKWAKLMCYLEKISLVQWTLVIMKSERVTRFCLIT